MDGRGEYKDLPAELKLMPSNVTLYRKAKEGDFAQSPSFGPEVNFAHHLSKAYPDKKIKLIKYSMGGTSLFDWSPEWNAEKAAITQKAELGSLYKKLQNFVGEVKPKEIPLAGILWMQGEKDSNFPEAGKVYAENLKLLIEAMRKDFNSPNAPFILGITNPPKSYAAAAEVNKAQKEAPQLYPLVKTVSTDGLSKLSDQLHYDTAGQIELGKRFAEAYLSMQNQ